MAQQDNINVNGLSLPVWAMQSTAQQIDDATQRIFSTPGSGAITAGDVGAIPAIEDTNNPGCYYRMVDGVQEWINPPMIIGTEYRTIKRYNGNPVYQKVFGPITGTAVPDSNLNLINSFAGANIDTIIEMRNMIGEVENGQVVGAINNVPFYNSDSLRSDLSGVETTYVRVTLLGYSGNYGLITYLEYTKSAE